MHIEHGINISSGSMRNQLLNKNVLKAACAVVAAFKKVDEVAQQFTSLLLLCKSRIYHDRDEQEEEEYVGPGRRYSHFGEKAN